MAYAKLGGVGLLAISKFVMYILINKRGFCDNKDLVPLYSEMKNGHQWEITTTSNKRNIYIPNNFVFNVFFVTLIKIYILV